MKNTTTPRSLNAPAVAFRWAAVNSATARDDQQLFADHPQVLEFVRRPLPDELPPDMHHPHLVLYVQRGALPRLVLADRAVAS